jgi:hypothetical protein
MVLLFVVGSGLQCGPSTDVAYGVDGASGVQPITLQTWRRHRKTDMHVGELSLLSLAVKPIPGVDALLYHRHNRVICSRQLSDINCSLSRLR